MLHCAAAAGVVREWKGRVGTLEAGGSFTPLEDSQPRYIARNGMRSLAQYLASTAKAMQQPGAASGGPPALLGSEFEGGATLPCPAQPRLQAPICCTQRRLHRP